MEKRMDMEENILKLEFVNGKRNGQGKYYWNGQLEFEGEFLNGDQIRGKEYKFGKLIYEGEYEINSKFLEYFNKVLK